MPRIRRWLGWILATLVVLAVLGAIAAGGLYYAISSKLPDVQSLKQVELQEPMYVYSSDGRLMAVYGETRRYPIQMKEVPERLKQAFLATEDARFYEHGGVDYKGIARAVWLLASTDAKRVPGGSTITQQVARQFFLNSEYSYTRKLAEILLARKIEGELTKDEIFELYLNKSFFGNRAYGVGAAAEYYYGKKMADLSLDEMASLAGIPKFPSSGNPISNPERARERRDYYVLQRMADLGFVTQAEADAAKAVPMHAKPHEPPVEVYAPYVAELVRQEMIAKYGGDVLNKGYHVTTTIDSTLQTGADAAVAEGLRLYDHRHGWHGVEQHFDVAADADAPALAKHLSGVFTQGGLRAVIVARTNADGGVTVVQSDKTELTLPASASRWTNKTPAKLLTRGDLTRIRAGEKDGEWIIDQLPRGQAALVSLDANSGALRALVGGFSFAGNKFNRATQARRQPGSSFKPFVYAAAFEKGFNPASIVLDAPVVFRDRRGKTWSPQNDGGGFRGPMRLREALVQSRNLVSVRLLDAISVDFARKYISQFGFQEAELPPNLSMSLGTASLTPLSVARGYAVFANGGSRVGHLDRGRGEGPRRQCGLQGSARCGLPHLRHAGRHRRPGQPGGGWLQLRRARAAQVDRASRRDACHACHACGNYPRSHRRNQDRAPRHRRAHCVSAGLDDARRGPARHRHRGQGAGTRRCGWQDRLHQRSPRRLVLRLWRPVRHHGVGWSRRLPLAGVSRIRRQGRAADLDRLHARGLEGQADRGQRPARWHDTGDHQWRGGVGQERRPRPSAGLRLRSAGTAGRKSVRHLLKLFQAV